MLWRIVRFFAGLAAGALLWWACGDAWNHALAAMTQPLMKIDRRIADGDLQAVGHSIVVQPVRGTMPSATIPADQLTFNVILLVALFASNRAPFSDRNMKAFAIAFVIVLLLQPIGLLISIESTYANQQGAWSDQHYGETAAHLWIKAEIFWRLIGMFGVVFAAWWLAAGEMPIASRRRRS
jgi:hypothetical protein